MAGLITAQRVVTINDGNNVVLQIPTMTDTITQSANRFFYAVKNVGTTEESIDFSTVGITTNGELMLENMDSTNYVDWGIEAGTYTGILKAGRRAGPFQLAAGATLYLKANTAACNVRIFMAND